MRRADQIAQLMANERTRPTRVLVRHQGIPDQALCVAVDPHQRKFAQLAHPAKDIVGRRHAARKQPRPPHRPAPTSRRRQRDMATRLKRARNAPRQLARCNRPRPVAQVDASHT